MGLNWFGLIRVCLNRTLSKRCGAEQPVSSAVRVVCRLKKICELFAKVLGTEEALHVSSRETSY